MEIRELRLLEVRVDIDGIEWHQAREPLPGLHQIADLHGAVADHAIERRADHGERQIALRLGERGLELIKRAERFDLLSLQHIDLGLRRLERRLAGLHGSSRLVAVGLRLLERLLARIAACGEVALALELELGARRAGLRGGELRLGLVDGGVLRRDLLADAVDGRLLGGDVVARSLDRELVVAVVDVRDDIALAHMRVVVNRNVGDIAGDLGRERRVLGAHIGVVGRDEIAARGPPVLAVPAGKAECEQDAEHER